MRVGWNPVAGSRAHVVGIIIPGASPNNPVCTLPGQPCFTIGWRILVVVMPAILIPFPNIALYIT